MNSITIYGADRAMRAGKWAKRNIQGEWNLTMKSFVKNPEYNFVFADKQDASWFALRWL